MGDLMRFGVSIERDLLDRFDDWVDQHGWANRSEAIRDLIRDRLIEDSWRTKSESVVATLTFVYNHHTTDLQRRLTRLQHRHDGVVLSSMHVHLDHHDCIEVLVMKGLAEHIQALADGILGTRGVKHGALVRSGPPGSGGR
jgi:CopG family nickel-responsive transcriptional regulator